MPGWQRLASVYRIFASPIVSPAIFLARLGLDARPKAAHDRLGSASPRPSDRLPAAMRSLALKPGNVHVFADGHGMTAEDFCRERRERPRPLSAPPRALGSAGASVGAVEASGAVGQNTNLGIVLLCAPLAAAA